MRWSVAFAVAGAGLLGAAPADAYSRLVLTTIAGTTNCGGPGLSPPPSPPFAGAVYDGAGCAAPAGDTTGLNQCEAAAAKALSRFAAALARCHLRQARAVFRNGGASQAISRAEDTCEKSAQKRQKSALRRRTCPSTVRDGVAALESMLLSGPLSLDAASGDVYCDSSAGGLAIDPGEDTGFVPSPGNPNGKNILKCEDAVARNLTTLRTALVRCHVRAATALSRAKRGSGGVDERACERTALTRYDGSSAKLTSRNICPPCLDAGSQKALGDTARTALTRLVGHVYVCAAGGPPLAEKIADIGEGCLYLPSGPPVLGPDAVTKIVDIASTSGSTLTLAASSGTGPADCTRGAGPGKHCLTNGALACSSDAECGGLPGACALDANCFFIPPLPIPNGPLSLCLVDVIREDETGTMDLTTGNVAVTEIHTSRVYLTGDPASPCPRCVGDICSSGKNAGSACTPIGSRQTAIECLPNDAQFALALELHELYTTGTSEKSDLGLGFCPNQSVPGALGRPDAVRVVQTGSPPKNLGDGGPHPLTLVSVFCVPPTGSAGIDAATNLPGVGTVSSGGSARLE